MKAIQLRPRGTEDKRRIYLARYEYTSLPHGTLALLWHTMVRLGAS